MAVMSNRVSLAELAISDIRLRPAEAVGIVSAICAQHAAGALPGIPSPGVVRLTRDGKLVIEGPITVAPDPVVQAALLLSDLLPDSDPLPEYRASGALRLVIARALGSLDLPPYTSLDEFRAALTRFETEDLRDIARALFAVWERAGVTRAFKAAPRADLTISDVRRARRATGLSLSYVATVAEVQPRRLRDLEWGYMRDWPATAEARAQVIRYARAAGLDESIVLSIAWPLIVEHASSTPLEALVPAPPPVVTVTAVRAASVPRHQWRGALIAAAAIVALLGAFVFGWRWSSPTPPPQDAVHVGVSGQGPAPPADTDRAAAASDAERPLRAQPIGTAGEPEPPRAVAAALHPQRVDPAPAASPAKAKRRRSTPPRTPPREEPRKSMFDRELFRIVIR